MERHSIKSLRYLSIFVIVANIIGNVLFFMRKKGCKIAFLIDLNIQSIVIFTSFTILMIFLGIVLNETIELNEEEYFIVKSKLRPLKFFNIIFIMYCVITLVVFKIKILFASSLIMETAYVAVIIYSKRLYASLITDRKLKWQKAILGVDKDFVDSNILWRLKIWILPFEKVALNRRKLESFSLVYIIAYIYAYYKLGIESIGFWTLTIFAIKPILSILEYVLGLYTSLNGICKGIDEFDSGTSREHWVVYITDFRNKREIVYRTYDRPNFIKDTNVKVTHGMFSKYVIKSIVIREKYR
ncbi:hypothetical protein QJR26_16910 [Clostridium baratii]